MFVPFFVPATCQNAAADQHLVGAKKRASLRFQRTIMFPKFFLVAGLLVSWAGLSSVQAQNIPMTFRNGSLQSIPLVIPGVMNPNLSPQSKSGVTLDVGQKVYFFPERKGGRRELLFEVKADWKADTIIFIDKSIELRKKELAAAGRR